MEKIATRGKSFIDEYGRERIFTGFNLVDKNDYNGGKAGLCYPFDEEFFAKFKAKGFSIIRLGFVWDAVEPEPGRYNEKLLDTLGGILDQCAANGVYAYLDIHQDCYSSYCKGDGAPAWATMTDGFKPRTPKFVWAEGYFFSRAVQRAFDNFWNNREYEGRGIQDRFADLWKLLAERFKDKPALFGFDFLNEPYPGTDGGKVFRKIIAKCVRVTLADKAIRRGKLIKDALRKDTRIRVLDQYTGEIFCKITGAGYKLISKFDREKYSPFLNKMTSAVREVTNEGIVFIDNSYWSNIGIPCSNRPIEVNGKREEKQCFSPHGYDLMVDTPAYKYASNSRVGAIFAEHKRTQERLGVPVLVGEWGGNAEGTEWFPHVEFLLETYEKNKWSNTYWCYLNGMLDTPLMSVLSRPYPKAVTGFIVSYRYDKAGGAFSLDFDQQNEFAVPTVLYAHRPVKSVKVDGAEALGAAAAVEGNDVSVKTGPGRHTVVVQFE